MDNLIGWIMDWMLIISMRVVSLVKEVDILVYVSWGIVHSDDKISIMSGNLVCYKERTVSFKSPVVTGIPL